MTYTLIGDETSKSPDHNRLYSLLNNLFVRVFDDFDGPDMHESCYVPVNVDGEDCDVELSESIPEAVKSDPLFGSVESDLLAFGSTSTRNTLLVLGTVGSGKSAVLKNVTHLIGKHQSLKDRFQVISVNFNAKKRDIDGAKAKSPELLPVIVSDTVRRAVVKRVRDLISEYEQEFWSYAWRNASFLSEFNIGLLAFDDDDAGARQYKRDRELEFVGTSEFIHMLVLFAHERTGKSFLLFLDNVDPLDRETHEALIWLATEFNELQPLRVVMSMRDNTHRALARELDPLNPLRVALGPPDIASILLKRTEFLVENCASFQVASGLRDALRRFELEELDAQELIGTFVEAALPEDTVSDLSRLANNNARLALQMSRSYFASPLIHSDRLAHIMRRLHDGWDEPEIPAHVFVQSIVTDHRRTHFPPSPFPTVLNIWAGPGDNSPMAPFVNLLVLNALARSGGTSTLGDMGRQLEFVFRRLPEMHQFFRDSLDSTVVRLINAWLIRTPEFLLSEKARTVPSEAELQLTAAGRFYVSELPFRIDYFSYMKDTIPLNRPTGAVSCISRNRFSERYDNSLRVIEYLLDEEIAWYKQMTDEPEVWARFEDRLAFPSETGPNLLVSRFVGTFTQLKLDHPHLVRDGAVARLDRIRSRVDESRQRFFESR